jgi:hypothetical protein
MFDYAEFVKLLLIFGFGYLVGYMTSQVQVRLERIRQLETSAPEITKAIRKLADLAREKGHLDVANLLEMRLNGHSMSEIEAHMPPEMRRRWRQFKRDPIKRDPKKGEK